MQGLSCALYLIMPRDSHIEATAGTCACSRVSRESESSTLSAGPRRVGMTKAVAIRKCPIVTCCFWQDNPCKWCKSPKLPSNYNCKLIFLDHYLETARSRWGDEGCTWLLLAAFGGRTCGAVSSTLVGSLCI